MCYPILSSGPSLKNLMIDELTASGSSRYP
jgi:hypothetical protein